MSDQVGTRHVKAANKAHWCSWCNHKIDIGAEYDRWRWFDGGDAGTVKVHPECLVALDETIETEGSPYEFRPGDNPRGCNCGFEKDCPRCKT